MKAAEYYGRLFTAHADYSGPLPNDDESRRWSKISTQLASLARDLSPRKPRLLDVGCGRGWMTHLASVYGHSEGVEPVAACVREARRLFPDLTFYVGTASDLQRSAGFEPFDVVLTSEVIEHVDEPSGFVSGLRSCLRPGGSVLLTTPRAEEFQRWRRLGAELQPIERWFTEVELRRLFEDHGFKARAHDRIYAELPSVSFRHRLAASTWLRRGLSAVHLEWLQTGLQYAVALYQVWRFELVA